MNTSFFDSKSMQLLTLSIGTVVLLVVIGVSVKVAFNIDAFEMISAGILAITGQSGAGVARNVLVDAPVRKMEAETQATITTTGLNAPPTIPQ